MTEHDPAVFWFTGLSGAGKTTISSKFYHYLNNMGYKAILLDGDEMRKTICSGLGFDRVARAVNIQRTAQVAKLFYDEGYIVLCALISPWKMDRRVARDVISGTFFEIYVECSYFICSERDTKGLYAKAHTGDIFDFAGNDLTYEPPDDPKYTANTETDDKETVQADLRIIAKTLRRD